MNIDNPVALQFIMQDDIFLLRNERALYEKATVTKAVDTPLDNKIQTPAAEQAPPQKAPEPVGPVLQQPVKQTPTIKYKGNNKSGYLVLVHYPSAEWMHDAHLTALESTFKRKGIDPAEVAIVNIAAHTDITFELFTEQLRPKKLLLMGKEALPAGIAAVKFNQLHQLAGCTALYTFSFGEMMDSNENKKIFWEQMKAL